MDGEQPGRTALDEAPGRALKFLSGVSQVPAIRAVLDGEGYDDAEHADGWALLHAASGYQPSGATSFAAVVDPAIRAAVVELDAWDEPNFARIGAALERHHPKQGEFLFANLAAAQGPAAVITVSTLLDRLDVLDGAPERKATHKEDLAALKLLAKRGYTLMERQRLRKLVEMAQRGTSGAGVDTDGAKKEEKARAQHEKALLALHLWWKDWATTARAKIKRRDYLIRLGLATRKIKKASGDDTGGTDGGATKP